MRLAEVSKQFLKFSMLFTVILIGFELVSVLPHTRSLSFRDFFERFRRVFAFLDLSRQ